MGEDHFTVMHPQNLTNGPMEDMIYFQKLEEASNIGVAWETVPASDWDTKPSLTLVGPSDIMWVPFQQLFMNTVS